MWLKRFHGGSLSGMAQLNARLSHSHAFTNAANVRSMFSTFASSRRSIPPNAPLACNFSNAASFCAAVPCMPRRRVSATLFFGLGLFSLPQHSNPSTRLRVLNCPLHPYAQRADSSCDGLGHYDSVLSDPPFHRLPH